MKEKTKIYFETGHQMIILGSFEDTGIAMEKAAKEGKWSFFTGIDEKGKEVKLSIKPFAVIGFSSVA